MASQTLELEEPSENVVNEGAECETSEPSLVHAQKIQLDTSLDHFQTPPTSHSIPGSGNSGRMQVCVPSTTHHSY